MDGKPNTAHTVTVQFRNEGPEPIYVLSPLEGSEYAWVEPEYRLEIVDPPTGQDLRSTGDAGTSG